MGERYRYWLVAAAEDGPVVLASQEVRRAAGAPSVSTRLFPVVPNPFNAGVELQYDLAHEGWVVLRVFDAWGRTVRTLPRGWLASGPGRCTWDGRDDGGRGAPSGLYLIRLDTGGRSHTVKATLAR